jgi:flagellar basal body-associated protein FliL
MKTKIPIIISLSILALSIITISAVSVCAQTSCVLKSYTNTITLAGTASQGANNQFPQTLAQVQQAASTALTDNVATQYGADVVKCDLNCRGKVTSADQHVQCIPKMTFTTTPASYNCNQAGTQCTASTTYTFLCWCNENTKND